MRPAIALPLLLITCIFLGSAFYVRHLTQKTSPGPSLATADPVDPAVTSTGTHMVRVEPRLRRPVEIAPDVAPPDIAGTAIPPTETSSANHSNYVQTRIQELQDLSMEEDAASLNTILTELGNRDPQIRHAALEATVQFGSREAIPKLVEASAQTEDPEEKKALLEAAEFLKLPSLTEVRQQQKTAAASAQNR